MNNGGLSSNTELLKKMNKLLWIVLRAWTVGVTDIALFWLWLASKGSAQHLALRCQQLGLPSLSPTDPPKSHHISYNHLQSALFTLENTVPSGSSSKSLRFAE